MKVSTLAQLLQLPSGSRPRLALRPCQRAALGEAARFPATLVTSSPPGLRSYLELERAKFEKKQNDS